MNIHEIPVKELIYEGLDLESCTESEVERKSILSESFEGECSIHGYYLAIIGMV